MNNSLLLSIISSPFDQELRFSCQSVKANTAKNGVIVILPKHCDMIFTINNSKIEVKCEDGTTKMIEIIGEAVAKIQNNNLTIFGVYKTI